MENPTVPIKGRKRRIIYNNDGDDLWLPAHSHTPSHYPARLDSVDQYLGLRTIPLEGTQVDSVFYCGFDSEPNWEFPTGPTAALGPDPLRHVVDFAHRKGLEFMYSIRMNDIHCSVHSGIGYWSKFKLENPQLLQANMSREEFARRVLPWARRETEVHPLADVEKRRGLGSRDLYSWAGYDYAYPEVRAYYLGAVMEACRRYDVDGIELDWGRFPFLFKFGEERRYIPLMTDFVRQIRQQLTLHGQKRGRPIQLAMHLPDTPAAALSVGLDAENWIRSGWVDLVVAGLGNAPFSFPIGQWIQLAHTYGIPVYGCLNTFNATIKKPEIMRAIASRFWDEGADGIYFFNFFDPNEYGILREAGDPMQLERADKLYLIDEIRGRAGSNLTNWPGQLPLIFTTQSGSAGAGISLKIVDQPETARQVSVLVRWNDGLDLSRTMLELNDVPLSNHKMLPSQGNGATWITYETQALRRGDNTIQVTVQPPTEGDPADPVTLYELQVSIMY